MTNFLSLYFPRDRIKALLLLLLSGAVYLPFLNNPLMFDDIPFFGNVLNYADAPFMFGFRWFPYVSLGVTSVFAGDAPPVFRVQNLLLHGMNVLLLLLVLRLWISLFIADASKEKMANWGAWLGALVFACHPLAVYGTGYLVQRSILMATMFTLIMHLAYFRGLLEGNKRYMALAVAAYFLAVFSKEHSLMAPALLLPMTWLLRARYSVPLRTLSVTWVGFVLVGVLVLLLAKGILGVAYEPEASRLFREQEALQGVEALHLLSILTQAGLFFKYIVLMLLPNPAWMSIDMRETFILSLHDWTSWIGLVAFLGYGIFAFICLLRGGRMALLGIALLYPWLMFMTEFSSIRVQEIFVLYRSYLWLPGLMLLWVLLLGTLPTRRVVLAGGLAALLLVPLAWNRLWVMADNYRLWDEAAQLLHEEDRLGAQRIYYNRGHYSGEQRNWDAAISDYRKSLSINSSYLHVHQALAGAYANAGRKAEALAELDRTIAIDPKYADAYYGKAFLLNGMHDKAGAMAMMQKSCDLGKTLACGMLKLNLPQNTNSSSAAPPQSP